MPKYLLMRLFIAIGLLFINTVNAQFGHLPPAVSKYQLDLLKKETDAGNHTAAISWCTLQLGYVV